MSSPGPRRRPARLRRPPQRRVPDPSTSLLDTLDPHRQPPRRARHVRREPDRRAALIERRPRAPAPPFARQPARAGTPASLDRVTSRAPRAATPRPADAGPQRAARAGSTAPRRCTEIDPAGARAPARAGRRASLPARADLLRHPADRAQAPRQLHRRDHAVRRRPGSRRPGDLLHRRPARDRRSPTTRRELRARVYDTDGAADRGRPGSRALHPLPPGRRPGAHRAALAAVAASPRSASSTACTSSATSPRPSASSSSAGLLLLPGAAGRRRARLPRRRGAGGRGPARAPRADARRRRALQRAASATTSSSCPSSGIPKVGARVTRPPGARRAKMSTTGGTRAGHGATCSTSPRRSSRSSSAR